MLAKTITSLQHPNVRHWAELRKSRAYREETKRVLISGEKMVKEFSRPILSLITVKPCQTQAQESFLVPEEILMKITGLEQPDGWAAEIELPPPQDVWGQDSLLILDQIQDPGNLGTLLRSALAFGWGGVIGVPGTVDFFNDKALRAARGATFHLPYCWQSSEEILERLQKRRGDVWIADLEGEPLDQIELQSSKVLILSREGSGVRRWTENLGKKIAIPMNHQVESLNVAMAGSILLYAMRKGR